MAKKSKTKKNRLYDVTVTTSAHIIRGLIAAPNKWVIRNMVRDIYGSGTSIDFIKRVKTKKRGFIEGFVLTKSNDKN